MPKGEKLKTHGLSNTLLYSRWEVLLHRLRNKQSPGNRCYKNIKCEWVCFEDFFKDMNKPFLAHCKKFGSKDTTLDRIDNAKNYNKQNCRWVTVKEQARNTRRVLTINHNNKKIYLSDLVKQTGLNYRTVLQRVNKGWSLKEILKIPAILGNNQKTRYGNQS